MNGPSGDKPTDSITVRLLVEQDVPEADRIFRLAFGTFLGLPEPMEFAPGYDFVGTRWRANPRAALAVEVEKKLAGSNFAANWGSVGFFGPITVHPDLWNRGAAQILLEATMEVFQAWGTRHIGLFTPSHSVKHVSLYQKFGFWPRFLTVVLSRLLDEDTPWWPHEVFSSLGESQKEEALIACRKLTDSVFEGLDLTSEIAAVDSHGLGDTILAWEDSKLAGVAVCHCGVNTEAGPERCYVKFGTVLPGRQAPARLERLLQVCQSFASARGLKILETGINLAQHAAYRFLLSRGFRAKAQGVSMHRPNESALFKPDHFLLCDWR